MACCLILYYLCVCDWFWVLLLLFGMLQFWLFCGSVFIFGVFVVVWCLLFGLIWFGLRFDFEVGCCDFDLR